MADIHVLEGDGIATWKLIFHFAVPNVNNIVGFNYRTVLVNSGLGGTSSMPEGSGAGEITAAELAQVVAGELFEHSLSPPLESGATDNAEMLVAAQAMYARDEARVIADLQKRLKYYGFTGSKA